MVPLLHLAQLLGGEFGVLEQLVDDGQLSLFSLGGEKDKQTQSVSPP